MFKQYHDIQIQAFAEAIYARGELDVLREICGQSLFLNFKTRLVSRPRAMSYIWELHELHGRTSVIDDRIAGLPQNLGYIRQAVIKITSLQVSLSLT